MSDPPKTDEEEDLFHQWLYREGLEVGAPLRDQESRRQAINTVGWLLSVDTNEAHPPPPFRGLSVMFLFGLLRRAWKSGYARGRSAL